MPASAQQKTAKDKRRKDERPDEIVSAAFEEFSRNGYAETRLQDVARRAGVSKGLPYLYFRTKEELFKAVVRRFIQPRFERMRDSIEDSDADTASLLRGPLLGFMQEFAKSRRARIVRLLVAEGPKHPDLTAFYVEAVLNPARQSLTALLERGVARGELKPSALATWPQLLMAPTLVGTLWRQLFQEHAPLDTDAMLAAHIEFILDALQVNAPANVAPEARS